jgi:hypothetical protein
MLFTYSRAISMISPSPRLSLDASAKMLRANRLRTTISLREEDRGLGLRGLK